MHHVPLSTVRRNPTSSSPRTAEQRGCKRAGRRLRFDRTIGIWLGGIVLGTAGCIIGASAPYHHPVAVTLSTLWWGIYIGFFGASVGALIGLLTESDPAAPSPGVERHRETTERGGQPGLPGPLQRLCQRRAADGQGGQQQPTGGPRPSAEW